MRTPYSNYYWRKRNWPNNLPRTLKFSMGVRPIFEYLVEHARQTPDRPALIFYENAISFKELDELSNSFAQFLLSAGVKKGDRVALFLPTFPGFSVAYLGISKMGGIMTACSPAFKEWELEHQLKDSEAKILVCLDRYMDIVRAIPQRSLNLDAVVVTGYRDFLKHGENPDFPEEIRGERLHFPGSLELSEIIHKYPPEQPNADIVLNRDICLLQYTGGTTGLPKGAMHTYLSTLYKTASVAQISYFGLFQQGNTPVPHMLPIYHIPGLNRFNANLYQGLTQIMIPRFNALEALKAIDKYRPEFLHTFTPMNLAMMDHPEVNHYSLRSVRKNAIASLGIKLTREIAERWLRHIAEGAVIMESSYGLTETHTGNTLMPADRPIKWGSVGIPAYGEEFKIVSFEDREKVLPIGQEGEIAVRSPSIFKGYWKKPKETAETLIGGWVFTGDIGRFDEEGYLYFLGRKKEMIKVSGYSVFPDEIEGLLSRHPSVENCAVKGIPDPRKGEVIKAFVVLRGEYKGKTTAEEIMEWAKKKISFYKVPRVIEFRDSLPRHGGTGKILRSQL